MTYRQELIRKARLHLQDGNDIPTDLMLEMMGQGLPVADIERTYIHQDYYEVPTVHV